MNSKPAHLTITSRNGVEFDMPFAEGITAARKRFSLVTSGRRFPDGASAIFTDAKGKKSQRVLEDGKWMLVG